MFDLFRSRAKAVRYLLGALLLLVALSMVVTLIPGFGSGSGADDPIVAEIGKEALTAREVQLNIQAALRGQSIPPEMVPHYVPDYINQMISDRALAYQARRMGFEVTDKELADAIRSIVPQLFENGKLVSRDAYENFIAQQNQTVAEFESNVRKQMLLNRLRNLALEGVIVTAEEVETDFRRREEKIALDYVSFTPEKLRSQVQASPQEIQDRYNQRKPSYRIPEKRTFQLVVFDRARIAESISLPEAELRRAYGSNLDRYRTPDRVRVRHILLKTTDKPAGEVDKIRRQAEDLAKQIRGGADFAALARKHSEDPGSAAKGGDLDWVARGQTVKNFENAAFSLKPNEISGVISTEYGFHIIQVLEKQEARLRPFEEVRNELAEELKKQQVIDRMQTLSDELRAALVRNPLSAAELGRKYGVPVIKVENAAAGDPIPEAGANPELAEALRSTGRGEVTPVVQLGEDRLLFAVVNEVHPSRQAELSEVEQQIRAQIVEEKARALARRKAEEAQQKLAGVNNDLKKLAQATGGEFKAAPEFSRDGAVEGLGSASYVAEAFNKPVGAVLGPVQSGESFFIVKVTKKVEPDLSKLAAQRESLVNGIKRRKAAERRELFDDGVFFQLVREGKVKIHEKTVKRLVASYRS